MRPLLRTLALTAALTLAVVAPASAAGPTQLEKAAAKLFNEFTTTGTFEPCDYTPEELEAALDDIGPDLVQYATNFPRSIREAIALHARGECAAPAPTPTAVPTQAALVPAPTVATGGSPRTPNTTPVPTRKVVVDPPAPLVAANTPQPGLPDVALESAATARPGADAPVPLIGLGVLAGLVLVGAAMMSTLRRLGQTEGMLAPQYHSWQEAHWRAGGVWEDFRDWLRLGR